MSRDIRVEDALLKMFGLQERGVIKLVITCEVGDAPILQVTQWIKDAPGTTETLTYKIGEPISEVLHVPI